MATATLKRYYYSDDGCGLHGEEFHAASDEDALRIVTELWDQDDPDFPYTDWVEVIICPADDCDACDCGECDYRCCRGESHEIEIPPPVPPCSYGEDHHVWREVSTRGNGAGLLITEKCDRDKCGVIRTTDTWATGPGGKQGYTAVRYH